MNWARAIAGVLVLWSSPTWGTTLMWDANTEPDLAGYRVYQCSRLPCTRVSGNASLLITLGRVTSFNIGTPVLTQHYILTAYDFANNESIESLPATFTPVVAPLTPPPVTPLPVAPPPPVPPAIGASPTSLAFAVTQGATNPASRAVTLSNTGGGILSWSVSKNADWFVLSQTSGTGNGVVTVSVVPGATATGTYDGSITVSAIGASPITVPVTLVVASAPEPPPAQLRPPPAPSSLRITTAQ